MFYDVAIIKCPARAVPVGGQGPEAATESWEDLGSEPLSLSLRLKGGLAKLWHHSLHYITVFAAHEIIKAALWSWYDGLCHCQLYDIKTHIILAPKPGCVQIMIFYDVAIINSMKS